MNTKPDAREFDAPFVFSANGEKSLYFTLDQLQSRMCCARPTELILDYTRTMMGFMLFNRQPRHIAMIGLGGGSLLKFCYRHLPATRFTVIEINPHVVALSQEFDIPQDEHRIEIVCAEGADFIHRAAWRHPGCYDVLLVDGFDRAGQAPSLCSLEFYDHCYQALSAQGVMVANLHHDDLNHAVFTGRIRLAFDGNLLEIASLEKSNSILFAQKNKRILVQELRENEPLERFNPEAREQLATEFARITWSMTEPSVPSGQAEVLI